MSSDVREATIVYIVSSIYQTSVLHVPTKKLFDDGLADLNFFELPSSSSVGLIDPVHPQVIVVVIVRRF